MTIDSFTHEYRFLSNFHLVYITHDGLRYDSVEHAYQASKTMILAERYEFAGVRWDVENARLVPDDERMTPSQAKRYGRRVTLRPDWEFVKLDVMHQLVSQKFQNPRLATMLRDTDPHDLVEGNKWGDTFWGVYNGVGENYLGKILMQVRDELRATARGER